jgi:hypothetical protein
VGADSPSGNGSLVFPMPESSGPQKSLGKNLITSHCLGHTAGPYWPRMNTQAPHTFPFDSHNHCSCFIDEEAEAQRKEKVMGSQDWKQQQQ